MSTAATPRRRVWAVGTARELVRPWPSWPAPPGTHRLPHAHQHLGGGARRPGHGPGCSRARARDRRRAGLAADPGRATGKSPRSGGEDPAQTRPQNARVLGHRKAPQCEARVVSPAPARQAEADAPRAPVRTYPPAMSASLVPLARSYLILGTPICAMTCRNVVRGRTTFWLHDLGRSGERAGRRRSLVMKELPRITLVLVLLATPIGPFCEVSAGHQPFSANTPT
jgi:hypothetical protein